MARPELTGLRLNAAQRATAQVITKGGGIELLELADGLEIRTTSWVGRLALGSLELTVVPKVDGAALADLLRYGYGLRDLKSLPGSEQPVPHGGVQNLLAWQLAAEAEELLARGLHRDYRIRREEMASPRGRIDVGALAMTGLRGAALPCIHHPRIEDNPVNRALRGALVLARRFVSEDRLRDRLLRLARAIDPDAFLAEIGARDIEALGRRRDRRLAAYGPALRIAGVLLEGKGSALEEDDTPLERLPGFMFDMNAFFQRLVSRLIGEGLPNLDVVNESGIRNLFGWLSTANPRGWRDPIQRPDFTIRDGAATIAVLDAKYRDLWLRPLPANMLYQLALYAVAYPSTGSKSAILYPTSDRSACEQVIELRSPVGSARLALVVLRPVHLGELRDALRAPGLDGIRKRTAIANRLAFGT